MRTLTLVVLSLVGSAMFVEDASARGRRGRRAGNCGGSSCGHVVATPSHGSSCGYATPSSSCGSCATPSVGCSSYATPSAGCSSCATPSAGCSSCATATVATCATCPGGVATMTGTTSSVMAMPMPSANGVIVPASATVTMPAMQSQYPMVYPATSVVPAGYQYNSGMRAAPRRLFRR